MIFPSSFRKMMRKYHEIHIIPHSSPITMLMLQFIIQYYVFVCVQYVSHIYKSKYVKYLLFRVFIIVIEISRRL
jgi:hypothetical protein